MPWTRRRLSKPSRIMVCLPARLFCLNHFDLIAHIDFGFLDGIAPLFDAPSCILMFSFLFLSLFAYGIVVLASCVLLVSSPKTQNTDTVKISRTQRTQTSTNKQIQHTQSADQHSNRTTIANVLTFQWPRRCSGRAAATWTRTRTRTPTRRSGSLRARSTPATSRSRRSSVSNRICCLLTQRIAIDSHPSASCRGWSSCK